MLNLGSAKYRDSVEKMETHSDDSDGFRKLSQTKTQVNVEYTERYTIKSDFGHQTFHVFF